MKLLFGVPLAALAMLWMSSAALAGGFAVTTLDPLPQAFHAGQTYRIGYVIRQHGVTPFTRAQPRIRISIENGEQLSFAGFPRARPATTCRKSISRATARGPGSSTRIRSRSPRSSARSACCPWRPRRRPGLSRQPPWRARCASGGALAILQVKRVTRPAATTATAQIASILTQAREYATPIAMAALVALLLGAGALALVQVNRVTRPAATTATLTPDP